MDGDKRRAYWVAAECLNIWDRFLGMGLKPSAEDLLSFRQCVNDIEELDPAWAELLRETYAEYL